MKLVNILLLTFLIASCAKVRTVNTQAQKFGTRPLRIIWMQVGGLDEQHLAMIRFEKEKATDVTSFERSLCVGKAWSYNLFQLRAEREIGFHGQMVGKKSMSGTCSDFNNNTIWSYLDRLGFTAGVFESNFKDSLLDRSEKCSEGEKFRENLYVWKMKKAPKKGNNKFFHYMEDTRFDAPGTYYDKSCQGAICYSSISADVKSVYQSFVRSRGKTLFIFRDGTYAEAIKKKDYGTARETLAEIEKMYGEFVDMAEKDGNTLVLLTSSAARNLELPKKGTEWKSFSKNITYKKSSLLSPVFAHGARAENFCGIYNESDILKRILWAPEMSQIEMDIRELVK